ncbi:hypothetical protein B0T24DRAFT_507241, partial [Lasiosphaeria ovina]
SEDSETLLSPYSDHENGLPKPASPPKRRRSLLPLAVILPAVLCFLFGVWLGNSSYLLDADKFCTRQVRLYWSPVLDAISPNYSPVKFNGSFLKENVYRQPASPAVDAAWEALGINYRSMGIPAGRAVSAGLSTSQHVQISGEHMAGGGFVADLEGLHHLHCLDLLRQGLGWNIEYYKARGTGPWRDGDGFARKHVTHCLDILRQQLMCAPDLSVLGSVWVIKDEPGAKAKPFVDFNTRHKCVDFEAVRAWAEAAQLKE